MTHEVECGGGLPIELVMAEGALVPYGELRQICDELLRHVAQVDGDAFRIEHDYFWSIGASQRRNPYDRPNDFSIGQLTECWDNLRSRLGDPDDRLSYELVWLGELLIAIGERIVR
jgi:hypothetical protein